MLTDRLAVVSGGTRGIGLAFSRRLIRLGYRVVALYRSDEAAAAAAAAELGDALRPVRVNVADADAVAAVAATILARDGAPKVVVNNAGVNVDRPLLDMSHEDWRTVVDTNLSGAFYVTKAFVTAMLDAPPGGVIVNVGATTGIRPRRDGANYCASKAGLLQLTRCLALELAPRIRVNCLIPGMTETPELTTRYRLHDASARSAVVAAIPERRIGTTEEIADALEFLVGPGSAYMTGQRLVIDGGELMC